MNRAVKSTGFGTAVKGTAVGFLLVGAGAALLLAVPADAWSALNLHIVGVIAIVTGVLWLLLLPTARGEPQPDRLRRLLNPSGVDDPDVDDVQVAAALDVAEIREDASFFSPGDPGRQRDEL
jgi:hypothetical protein